MTDGRVSAKPPKTRRAAHKALTIGLRDPGMTPLLRAGLGGLATALRSLLLSETSGARWPSPVALGDATAHVSHDRVTFEWGDAEPAEALDTLFAGAFQLSSPHGFIALPATWNRTRAPDLALINELQKALRVTFLQHGSSAKKREARATFIVSTGARQVVARAASYETYKHRDAAGDVVAAMHNGSVALAGWAYPGAAHRHPVWAETGLRYDAAQALCACFALIGCVSHLAPLTRGGVLVILEPSDLVRFAELRALLSPARAEDVTVSSTGEALLRAYSVLRTVGGAGEVAATHGVSMRVMPWAAQQKSRAATLTIAAVNHETLDGFERVARAFPSRLRAAQSSGVVRARRGKEGDETSAVSELAGAVGEGYFVATSGLRGLFCDNLLAGRRWFEGFVQAAVGARVRRTVYRVLDDDKRGALYENEREGLMAMLNELDEAQGALVRSIHAALSRPSQVITLETRSGAERRSREAAERERLGCELAHARTHEQLRATLAKLWGRAGANRELGQHWEKVLALLHPARWQCARDLALIALASYQDSSVAHPDEDRGERRGARA